MSASFPPAQEPEPMEAPQQREPVPAELVKKGDVLEVEIRQGGAFRRIAIVGKVTARDGRLFIHGHYWTGLGGWSSFTRALHQPFYRAERPS